MLDVVAADDRNWPTQLGGRGRGQRRRRLGDPGTVRPASARGVPDSDPGRASILAGIEALEAQTPTIVAAAEALGLTINVT